ncbi:hypothetical protein [Micromonospora sp. CB01531]|uniref:hypothetical protein n=1 Tax=Micromonospora sp. CB01531 TaxID=1718947 RepID=UPI00093D1970|nr:hypothetical protein [Micromonospora sp. CB01531]OKI45085.1 hypothetical protein A6A27_11740 [Micromonospora sp. CB01531]
MTEQAHEMDMLVVGWLNEASQYPQFHRRQVFSAAAPERLYGRRFRRAYYTPNAPSVRYSFRFFDLLHRYASMYGGEVLRINQYELFEILDQANARENV